MKVFLRAVGLFQAGALLLCGGLAPAAGPRYTIGVCTETVTRTEDHPRRVEQQINVQGRKPAAATAPDRTRDAS